MPLCHGKQRQMKNAFLSKLCCAVVIVTWQENNSKKHFMYVILAPPPAIESSILVKDAMENRDLYRVFVLSLF